MIGVDVVDLSDPLLKPRTKAHFRFIAHPKDNLALTIATHGMQLAWWLYWSAKESVFKAYREYKSYKPSSIPIAFTLSDDEIVFESGAFKGFAKIDGSLLFSCCSNIPLEECHFEHFVIPSEATDTYHVRIKAMQTARSLLQSESIKFTEDKIPTLSFRGKNLEVSLSHHGEFGAFGIPLQGNQPKPIQ